MAKHGENIRKRKDGRWEGRFTKGRNSDRTAIWGHIYGHSYTEVKEKLKAGSNSCCPSTCTAAYICHNLHTTVQGSACVQMCVGTSPRIIFR